MPRPRNGRGGKGSHVRRLRATIAAKMVIKLVRARPQIGKDSGVVTAKAQRTEMKTADAKRETMLNKPHCKKIFRKKMEKVLAAHYPDFVP